MAFYNKLKELSMSQYSFRLGTGMQMLLQI
jgi:hypothetical protein